MNLSATAPGAIEADLQNMAARIDSEYYELIEQINSRIANALSDAENLTGVYFDLCRDLSAAVKSSMEDRRLVLVPYLAQLQEKEAGGHNCSTCSGVCKVQHSVHIANVTGSHVHIRDILDRIAGLQDFNEPTEKGDTVILYESVITNMILDLFELEEKQLIPEIVKAQKAINAH